MPELEAVRQSVRNDQTRELEHVRQRIRNCLTGRTGSRLVKVFETIGLAEFETVGQGVRKGPTYQIVACR